MDYDSIAKGYNELHSKEQLKKVAILKRELYIKSNKNLLDVGCGTGISTQFPCKTMGIDSSKEMLKQLKGKKVHGKAEALPFEDNSFDIVISVSAIHNFDDPSKAIDEMKRVCKKDGQIAITLFKKAKEYKSIKKLIEKKLIVLKEIDEDKDTIFICSL